jgi:hypothetical protein
MQEEPQERTAPRGMRWQISGAQELRKQTRIDGGDGLMNEQKKKEEDRAGGKSPAACFGSDGKEEEKVH